MSDSRITNIAQRITHRVTLDYIRRIGMNLIQCDGCGFIRLQREGDECSHADHAGYRWKREVTTYRERERMRRTA